MRSVALTSRRRTWSTRVGQRIDGVLVERIDSRREIEHDRATLRLNGVWRSTVHCHAGLQCSATGGRVGSRLLSGSSHTSPAE